MVKDQRTACSSEAVAYLNDLRRVVDAFMFMAEAMESGDGQDITHRFRNFYISSIDKLISPLSGWPIEGFETLG